MTLKPPCWLVYVEDSGRPRKGHATLESARTEAQRLLTVAPGKRVWVFATVEEFAAIGPSGKPLLKLKKRVDAIKESA